MNKNQARLIFFTGVAAGAVMLLIGYAARKMGFENMGGVRYGSNLVPMLLFGGMATLFLSIAWGTLHKIAQVSLLTRVCILALAGICAYQSFTFLRYIKPLVLLRVDLAMGSESQFVDQIIRYRAGAPQYTPAEDANSTAYSPAAPMLTYWLAKAAGKRESIPAYRAIQLLYVGVAVVLFASAAWMLLGFLQPDNPYRFLWLLFWLPFLFLMGTNNQTNVYTFVLYSDALGLAANAVAFWLLVRYHTSGNSRWLILMAIVPGIGFLAKQKEAVWAGLYSLYLYLNGRLSLKSIAAFSVPAFASVGIAAGICYALWGQAFWFWNFQVLNRLHVEISRTMDQLANGAIYFLPGIVGAVLLQRARYFKAAFPLIICWVLHAMVSVYTSGIAYRPAHLGPATMAGCVLFLTGLAASWPGTEKGASEDSEAEEVNPGWRAALISAALVLYTLGAHGFFAGDSVPAGMEEYVTGIEREFQGAPLEKVLIDSGSWLYLPRNVVMKDRESPMGTLGGTGAYDMVATIRRIEDKYYDRMLLHKRMYFFIHPQVRFAVEQNYEEVRTVPSPGIPRGGWFYTPLLSDVGVYVPRAARPAADVPASKK